MTYYVLVTTGSDNDLLSNSTKPLQETVNILSTSLLETHFSEIYQKLKTKIFKEIICECHLQNVSHFVKALMCQFMFQCIESSQTGVTVVLSEAIHILVGWC